MYASHDKTPAWTWIGPVLTGAVVALEMTGVLHETSVIYLVPAVILLGVSVFASVHHAEICGARVGEPIGSIILACCVTLIEVALIVSMMLGESGENGGALEVARDTVFAAMMIVLNGIIGLCLLLGAHSWREQSFKLDAASAALAVLGTIAALAFVLPNYAVSGEFRQYSPAQLVVISLCCLGLYGVFLYVQTVRHRGYFVDETEISNQLLTHPEAAMAAAYGEYDDADAKPAEPRETAEDEDEEDDHGDAEVFFAEPHPKPPAKVAAASAVLLPVSLLMVILVAETLSEPLRLGLESADLPLAMVGVVIAFLVLLPEGISSVHAARRNRIQRSINLALGSALASIGMSIPVVSLVAILTGRQITLGLEPEQTVLLVLTLFVSTITLGTGRTTVLQGAVHLVIFAAFVLVTLVP